MKKIFGNLLLVTVLFYACKTEKKEANPTAEKEQTILEKVAYAHGYEHWSDVSKIQFTFNVDRDTSHFERRWVWNINTNSIAAITGKDTLVYQRKNMDSVAIKTNGGFINDRYWILAPFNLIWDKNSFTHTHDTTQIAPISKKPMQKLTIAYGAEGGYTPGDAYDFYFEDDYIIREWVFRKSNQEEPSLITTWEDYEVIKNLKLGKMHQKADGSFKLYFTGVQVD